MEYMQKMSSSSDWEKLRSKNDRNGTESQAGVDRDFLSERPGGTIE